MIINEHQKWPSNEKKYSREYNRVFGGHVICPNCGYLKSINGICTKCFRVNYVKEKRNK